MEITVKHFSELTATELFEIYRIRSAVFVVEQNCPYQDIDVADKEAYHIWIQDEGRVVAYARVLPPGTTFETVAIGRVLSVKRRCGVATLLMREAINVAQEKFSADKITLGAQVYAKSLYEKVGFHQISDEYLEDGIPHILMELLL